MCSASQSASVATTRNTNQRLWSKAMGTLGNLELPVQMSPCLRIFIASLFDESTSSVTGEIHGLRLMIAIGEGKDTPRGKGEASAQSLGSCVAVATIHEGRDARVARAVTTAFGVTLLKAK